MGLADGIASGIDKNGAIHWQGEKILKNIQEKFITAHHKNFMFYFLHIPEIMYIHQNFNFKVFLFG